MYLTSSNTLNFSFNNIPSALKKGIFFFTTIITTTYHQIYDRCPSTCSLLSGQNNISDNTFGKFE